MRPLLGLVLLGLLTGCYDDGIAWTSPLGVDMLTEGLPDYFTPEQLDEQVGYAVDRLTEAGLSRKKLIECLDFPGGPRIWVVPNPYRCNDWTDRKCNGSQLVQTIIIVAKPCRYETALMHEFGHYFQMCAENGLEDVNHEETRVWSAVGPFMRTCTPDELYVPPTEQKQSADIEKVDTQFLGGVQ